MSCFYFSEFVLVTLACDATCKLDSITAQVAALQHPHQKQFARCDGAMVSHQEIIEIKPVQRKTGMKYTAQSGKN